jgi:diaminohydroxyphosphoribosylaminopyrimidine deaminase/5-amino-6-(5-phosphoribosylamino)uracil reductase
MTLTHEHFMAQAFREAERGMYTTRPNPRVGCVLVKDGEIISRGFHLQDGAAHAEQNALKHSNTDVRGATAYVTLEPCSFQGRTPSCAQLFVEHGVSKVVYAAADPHPGNRGLGLDKMRAGGVEVIGPVMEKEAVDLNPGHFKKFTTGLPLVRLKIAASLDGKTALSNGESKWITGPDARRDVQSWRAKSCAVITGVETIIADDPSMAVRESELLSEHAGLAAGIRRPIVVLDSNGRLPDFAAVRKNSNLVHVTGNHITSKDKNHLPVELNDSGQVDLLELLKHLVREESCSEVLFECGATLAGNLLEANLVDELIVYLAPKLMGSGARELVNMGPFSQMDQIKNFDIAETRQVGDDLRLILKPRT